MQIKISEKNSKIGKIPNLSLPPGRSCVGGVPCYNEGCYARGPYGRYPNTKAAWDMNLDFFYTDCQNFFREFDCYLTAHTPERFRMFVGGDFPNPFFYECFQTLASLHTTTDFLAFTKRYEYNFTHKPDNLKLILSVWPGYSLPKNKDLPWAWLEEDERRPTDSFFMCPGKCDNCGHQCWDAVTSGFPVVFKRHRA